MTIYNIDLERGIHYGVIPIHEVLQAWADCSEPDIALEEEEDVNEEEEDVNDDAIVGFSFEREGYRCYQDIDSSDIFVMESPFYTLCAPCSPCAPGAGYLLTKGKLKAYCFGHDWFEEGKAPYRVFSVGTGEEVLP